MGDSKRQGWMLDPQNEMTDVFRASGREKTNREIERERQQQESERIRKEREIKPIENSSRGYEYGDKGSSWRMMKLKRVFDIAKEEGVSVEKIALERYGVLEEYQEALKEREFLDLDKKSNQHGTKSNLKRPSFKPPSEFARPNKLEKSSHRNREEIDRDSSNSKKEEDDTVYRRRKDDSPTRKAPLPQAIAPVVKYELDEPVLSKDQLNKLHAKVLKAKMLKLPELEELEEEYYYELAKAESGDKIIVVPSVNSKGELHAPEEAITRNRNTHDKKGNRLGYEDEGEQTLDDLVRYEKLNKTSDFDKNLSHQIARDSTFKDDLDYMDDSSDRLSRKKKDKRDNSEKRAIRDYKKSEAALAECVYCYHDNQPPKITMISIGNSVYLALPETIDMVKYHCLIVPIQHANTTLELDDQAWDEIRQRHTVIECIPVPNEVHEDLPGYFKEALLNVEGEYTQHKSIINTDKGFRRSLVKNLPYFHIWFDPNHGMGHVIEEPKEWQHWFGRQVIASAMDLPPDLWRRPKYIEPHEVGRRRKQFMEAWSDFDWTKMLDE